MSEQSAPGASTGEPGPGQSERTPSDSDGDASAGKCIDGGAVPGDQVHIANAEFILRALVKDDVSPTLGVKWQAVAPRITEHESSVMRLALLAADGAKQKAIELKGEKLYALARASTETLRAKVSDVRDSRDQYYGHADLVHPFPRPPRGESPLPGEPIEPTDEYREAVAYYRAVAGLFCVYVDAPTTSTWTGSDLSMVCENEPSGAVACVHPQL